MSEPSKSMTFFELAMKVLKEEQRPLSAEEIWKIAQQKGYANQVRTKGKTPSATIGAKLYVNIRDDKASPFVQVSRRPARFALKAFAKTTAAAAPTPVVSKQPAFKERDLHPLLSYFLYTYHTIYTKTIHHQESIKDRYAQWLYPDMVGVNFSLESLVPEVLEIAKEVSHWGLKLFSYELKRELTLTNLRESFFQAVSNSSWAHQGYLVAAEIEQDEEFLQELKRLSTSFGIGVIRLDVQKPDDSEVLILAQEKESVDVHTMNRLAEVNPNFREFLKRVKTDLTSKEIRKERYEKVLDSETLRQMFMKQTEQSFYE